MSWTSQNFWHVFLFTCSLRLWDNAMIFTSSIKVEAYENMPSLFSLKISDKMEMAAVVSLTTFFGNKWELLPLKLVQLKADIIPRVEHTNTFVLLIKIMHDILIIYSLLLGSWRVLSPKNSKIFRESLRNQSQIFWKSMVPVNNYD